ncbi:MAG: shikimate dehydrogenase, partial [Pseudomonadota bacterium]
MRRYLMIGAPVTSVRTPPLLTARLRQLGAPAAVEAVHVEPESLGAFMDSLRADLTVDGLMVTMPHKRAIRSHLDALSATARRAEGVNAVKRLGDRLVGAQFDGIALRSALTTAGADLRAARVWLAGLGGAGLAIAQALHARCGALFLSETDPARLGAALADLQDVEAVEVGREPAADVIINATPLGMNPDDPSPFSDAAVTQARIVADIVADPIATRLVAQARRTGTPLVTGRVMVEHQIAPIADWL